MPVLVRFSDSLKPLSPTDKSIMSASSDHPVRLQGLVKIYTQGARQIRALHQVDLTVRSGEFVAIMGASGSGKSTLLHAIAGLTDVNEGKVIVAGQDLASFSDAALTRFRRKQVGMVFQAFNLIPSLTAEENIQLPAMELPDVKARAEAILQRLGLLDRRHHRPDALSGGEQQRVAIGRALMMEPAIVLADEPTGSLDSRTGQELCQVLRDLVTREGRTTVMVTHEPRVAMWADRVVVFKDGRCLSEFPVTPNAGAEAVALAYEHALQSAA